MVLANGFITTDRQTALQQLIEQSGRRHDIRIAVMPPLCSMTYFISDIGEVYGCQLLRNICLTKPIKIERRYSKGCNIRYSTSPKHQTNAYMQYIMYATFVTGQWDDTLQLEPIDGNPYNYRLDNIRVKDERADVFYTNLNTLKEVYRSHFLDVAHYTRLFSPIDMQDAKDIASDAFLEICRTDYGYSPDNFVGLWKFKAKQRTLDFLSIKNRFDSLFYENGEERFHNKETTIETADALQCITGERRKRIFRQHLRGDTNHEIAKDMNISYSTVGAELSHIRQILRKTFKKDINYQNKIQ